MQTWINGLSKLKSYSQLILLFLGSIAGQVITLFQSSKPIYPCGPVLTFLGKLHLSVMCDVSFYMRDAQDLNRLRFFGMNAGDYGTVFQERPFMALFGKIFSYFFQMFPFLNQTKSYSGIDSITVNYSIPIYVSYIFLNSIFLIIGISLVLKLFLGENWKRPFDTNNRLILILILTVFVFNRLMTYYFWIPNSDILISIFAAYLAYLVFNLNKLIQTKSLYFHLLFISIFSLFYALFLVTIPVILLALLIRKKYKKSLIPLMALLPFLAWPLIINASGGNYVNYEFTKFKMFIWFYDDFKSGQIFHSSGINFISLIKTFEIPPIIMIATGLLLIVRDLSTSKLSREDVQFKSIFRSNYLWSVLVYFAWIYLIGLYEPRFSWGFSLFLILIIWKRVFDHIHSLRVVHQITLILASLIWFSGWLNFRGPYF